MPGDRAYIRVMVLSVRKLTLVVWEPCLPAKVSVCSIMLPGEAPFRLPAQILIKRAAAIGHSSRAIFPQTNPLAGWTNRRPRTPPQAGA